MPDSLPFIDTVQTHDGEISVVRDDLYPGGTKARVLPALLGDEHEYVYASPVFGYAQIALAHVCRKAGKQAVIFCAKRAVRYRLTEEAEQLGARIVEVDPGYLSVCRARAAEYCGNPGLGPPYSQTRKLLPFGLKSPAVMDALARLAAQLPVTPQEVWTVGRAIVLNAPEKFEQDATILPPFPSCLNYDAKAWRFIQQMASPGALFWNVAG